MVKIGQIFHVHGKFCASHPWEVIVALVTFTACMFSVDRGVKSNRDPLISEKPSVKPLCHGWRESCDGFEDQYLAADAILMTIVRCSALLYCYYQFCNLNKLGSKYILGKFSALCNSFFSPSIIETAQLQSSLSMPIRETNRPKSFLLDTN